MALTAFLTGATGFVGMHLARELTGNGWQVTALVREGSPLEDIDDLGLDLRLGELTDARSVLEAMPPDVECVYHVAASTNVWSRNNALQTRVNVEGTRNLVAAAMERRARRMVHTSSFVVWGFQHELLTEESSRLENADWINYVRTKHEAEQIVKRAVAENGLDAVILNPAHILGPGDRRNWSRMIRLIDQGKLPGVPPGGGAFADVREVARAHVAAYHHGRTGNNYLLGGEDAPFIEVVRIAGELLGRKVPRRASPAWLLKAVAQLHRMRAVFDGQEPEVTPEAAAMITRHIRCDSARAQRELGYRFTPVDRLLEDTVTWMRDKGMLRAGSS
jgi:nucleoside-diphosphate-sugar epimerase